MPTCQESFINRALHLPHATRSAMDAHCKTVCISYHVTQIAAYWCKASSTNQDSVLNMCGRITVKNVQSQPSLTQSARAAMLNNVRYKGNDTYVYLCCFTSYG